MVSIFKWLICYRYATTYSTNYLFNFHVIFHHPYIIENGCSRSREQVFGPPGNPGSDVRAREIPLISHPVPVTTAVADPAENRGTGPAGQGQPGKQGFPLEENLGARESPVTTRDLARVSQTSGARQGIGQGTINLLAAAIWSSPQPTGTRNGTSGPNGKSTITGGVQGTGYALLLKPERAITGEVLSLRPNRKSSFLKNSLFFFQITFLPILFRKSYRVLVNCIKVSSFSLLIHDASCNRYYSLMCS